MKIIVNTIEKDWPHDSITHDEVITLAGHKVRDVFVYSITYQQKKGEWRREGILNFGAELKNIEDGIIFDCFNTGNA